LLAPAASPQELRGLRGTQERERLNNNRIGLITGGPGGNYMRLGADIARLLDDHADLSMRVIVMFGKGSLQNIDDLCNLRLVDAAIVQADVLRFIQLTVAQLSPTDIKARGLDGINAQVSYITRLYDEEVHLLGRAPARGLQDLAGKVVNLGEENSGTFLTAWQVLDLVGINVDRRTENDDAAFERLKRGEIDAMFFVAGKPAPLFARISAAEAARSNLRFLAVPSVGDYAAAQIGHDDYPGLVAQGENVATIAGPAVLATYNWPKSSPRYQPLARFTHKLLDRIRELPHRYPSFPKYAEIDPHADLPGWSRYTPAAEWLASHPNVASRPNVVAVPSCNAEVEQSFRDEGLDPSTMPWGQVQARLRHLRSQGRC